VTVHRTRFDPYKSFKFRIGFVAAPAIPVAGFVLVNAPHLFDDATATRPTPGRDKYEPITLERGVTQDASFQDWVAAVRSPTPAPARDILITLFNEAGQPVACRKVLRCRVSEYQGLPDLDGNANAIAIEHIKLENEGWERVPVEQEPTQS
jgi:phage tail-like protein